MPTIVAGFDLPANRHYHQGHTWALQESPTLVRVGIDDFGARLLGRVDEIVLPKRGQWLRQGQKFVTFLRDGQKTELVSPVEGEVTNVNEALVKDFSLSNSDPYGQGWLLSVVSPDVTTTFRNLLSGSLARKWMAEASHRLQTRIPVLAGAVAQDGGVAVHDLTLELPTMSKGILYDATLCIGCKMCEKACAEHHGLPYDDNIAAEQKPSDHKYTVVLSHEDKFMRRLCMNCQDPTCASVCPVGAFRKSTLGPVVYEASRCIGCRYCMMACPFSVPKYEWSKALPLVRKCDMCTVRLANGLPTACAEVCPTGATKIWRPG
jgi:glycine cleavage system H protein